MRCPSQLQHLSIASSSENIDDDLTPLTGLGDPRLGSLCYFCLTRIILLFLFDVDWHAASALALELKGHFKYAVLVIGLGCSCIDCFWQLNSFVITRLSSNRFNNKGVFVCPQAQIFFVDAWHSATTRSSSGPLMMSTKGSRSSFTVRLPPR